MDRAWQRKNFTALLARESCSDQRAAAAGGFDDQRAEAQSADQAIALREEFFLGVGAEREFADERSGRGNFLGEPLVGRRVDPIDAMTQEGDGTTAGSEGTTVCSSIDTLRQPADNREAGTREMLGELEGVALAALGRIAATDDRDGRQVQNVRVAVYI